MGKPFLIYEVSKYKIILGKHFS